MYEGWSEGTGLETSAKRDQRHEKHVLIRVKVWYTHVLTRFNGFRVRRVDRVSRGSCLRRCDKTVVHDVYSF